MAFDLRTASKGRRIKAPFALFYGPPKVGKTSFCAGAPNALLARCEDGAGDLSIARWPQDAEDGGTGTFQSLSEFVEFLEGLLADPQGYQTLIVDSVSALERLVWSQVMADEGVTTIDAVGGGFQKGYRDASHYWAALVKWWKALQGAGIAVLLIGHADASKFRDPMQGEYDRYSLRLHKWASAILMEECDLIGFLVERRAITTDKSAFGKETKRATSQRRILYLENQPSADAGCRYSGLVSEIEIPNTADPTSGWALFSQAFAAAIAAGQPAAAKS